MSAYIVSWPLPVQTRGCDGSLHSPARSPTGQGRGAAQPWVPLVGEVPEFMTIDERNRLKAHTHGGPLPSKQCRF